MTSPNSSSFANSYFSRVPSQKKSGDSFPFKFKKNWKHSEVLASPSKNKITNSSKLLSEDVNVVTSASDQLVGHSKQGVKQKIKVDKKTKRPSRSKKNKEQLSAGTVSEEATVEKRPTQASKVSSSNFVE